jgi:hypothetical protein
MTPYPRLSLALTTATLLLATNLYGAVTAP